MDRKQQVLQDFINQVDRLRTVSCRKNNSMSEEQFMEYILSTHFADILLNPPPPRLKTGGGLTYKLRFLLKCFVALLFVVAMVYTPFRQAAGNLFMKNIQSWIYSGMSLWRLLTVPLIRLMPALTELYDESCLLENPLFQIQDMDCRPCVNVLNVLNLSEMGSGQPLDVVGGGGVPHVFKNTNGIPVTVAQLHQHYLQHQEDYRLDAFRVTSTHPMVSDLDTLFGHFLNRTSSDQDPWHALWRCNRMNPVRLLRQLIHHPDRLPRTGMSIERFLAIDIAGAPPYAIPDPECSNVFIHQVLGSRTMVLRPTSECGGSCRTISVRLNESHVLMYDWWYWKPVSMADADQLAPSISYIGAYC